jgi:branched-subunit amino acid aminotransferase/4-amino-4-deoxychorismate lyase
MRRVVIEACRRRGMPVREEDVVPGQLEVADGLFQTNAVIGIREIGELDGRPFAAPEMLERVRSAVREFADA